LEEQYANQRKKEELNLAQVKGIYETVLKRFGNQSDLMSKVSDFKKQHTQVSKEVEKIEDEIAEKKKEIEKLKKEELGIREGVTPESQEEWIETEKIFLESLNY
jgi:uncharacterized protein involved in exopolysaccharide biosynthesis